MLSDLPPFVRRYRAAQLGLARAASVLDDAEVEFRAAQQELIDAIEEACKEIR